MSIATAVKYRIVPVGEGDDTVYSVININGKHVSTWLTVDGAAAAAELLNEGYIKE